MQKPTMQQVYSAKRRSDYRAADFTFARVELHVDLDRELTTITSRMSVSMAKTGDFALLGKGISLQWLKLNGETLNDDDYQLSGEGLVVHQVPLQFELEVCGRVSPAQNAEEIGLFEKGGHLATECEPDGFSRLCFFPDRPDVMAAYRVTLVGDKSLYPVMLSNGNCSDRGDYGDGRHWVTWEDPVPKPSYIFAIFAGRFARVQDCHTTGSGRHIELNIYIDSDLAGRCAHAMAALKRALAWEERVYGLEYDLDTYSIVALSGHGNCMENKGLNLFPAEQIVACPDTATDEEHMVIERIIAHEVFHNWTGNRITCRDWFQLCLKEGLTRFRDRCYDQSLFMAGVKRISLVKELRRNQFPTDDSPAAHAVRPESYYKPENFYNSTVYDKGAELVRMLYLLLGEQGFHQGMRLFVARHDLQAVTVEQFLAAMADASGRDLAQFAHWYSLVGRPLLRAAGRYDAEQQTYTLNVSQGMSTAGQAIEPMHLPLALGFVSRSGRALPFRLGAATGAKQTESIILEVSRAHQQFVFTGLAEEPVVSLLRGLSAPVSLQADYSQSDLALLMSSDSDPYVRWDAAQRLTTAEIRRLASLHAEGKPLALESGLLRAFEQLLAANAGGRGLVAQLLDIVDEPSLSEGLSRIDLDGLMAGRDFLMRQLSQQLREPLLRHYHACDSDRPWRYDEDAIGRRMMKNACLRLLASTQQQEVIDLCWHQLTTSDNMTDRFAALVTLIDIPCEQRDRAIDWTYAQWRDDRLVMGKWFKAQAMSRTADTIERLQALTAHPAFDIGNTAHGMALLGTFFRQNRVAFHRPDGSAYQWLADTLLMLDSTKPAASSWLMLQIIQWRRYDDSRQQKMRTALERIAATAGISETLYENVTRALN